MIRFTWSSRFSFEFPIEFQMSFPEDFQCCPDELQCFSYGFQCFPKDFRWFYVFWTLAILERTQNLLNSSPTVHFCRDLEWTRNWMVSVIKIDLKIDAKNCSILDLLGLLFWEPFGLQVAATWLPELPRWLQDDPGSVQDAPYLLPGPPPARPRHPQGSPRASKTAQWASKTSPRALQKRFLRPQAASRSSLEEPPSLQSWDTVL